MLEILKFIFDSFWTFVGVVFIISLILSYLKDFITDIVMFYSYKNEKHKKYNEEQIREFVAELDNIIDNDLDLVSDDFKTFMIEIRNNLKNKKG